jgi:hypothetical protein
LSELDSEKTVAVRLPDRYRKSGLTAVKNALASGHLLEMAANGLVLMVQMLLEEFREFVSATPGERIND